MAHRVLATVAVRPLMATLPKIELVLGIVSLVAVVVPSLRIPSLLACTVLFTSFTGYLTVTLYVTGGRVPCGCLPGDSSSALSGTTIVRTVALAAVAGAGLAWPNVATPASEAVPLGVLMGATLGVLLLASVWRPNPAMFAHKHRF